MRQNIRTTIILLVLSANASINALSQTVPSDFEVIATAGGLTPDAEYAVIHLQADGQGSYDVFSTTPGTPPVQSSTFTASTNDLEAIWSAIQSQNFFALDAEYTAEDFTDRTWAELVVTADGSTHRVVTQNLAVQAFDAIMDAVNGNTPGDASLVYYTEEPFSFTSLDVCERVSKNAATQIPKSVLGKSSSSAEPVLDPSAKTTPGELPHPGTSIACQTTLSGAVASGAVSLEGKGGYYGDVVSITVDNTDGIEGGELTLNLYLEFWGEESTAEDEGGIESAIENYWSGMMTSDGEDFTVDVQTRSEPGLDMAPGTPGYHQILLKDDVNISNVVGRGSSFDVNRGVGTGTWERENDDDLYAHEAGHLLGFPDRYVDYRKQDDGTWERLDDDMIFTTVELAQELDPIFPNSSQQELEDWLDDRRRVTHPEPGHENDLMATLNGTVMQSDIDALAAYATCSLAGGGGGGGGSNVNVAVRPGDILLSKQQFDQNLVITRSQDFFVPAGEERTLGGLYAACIDHFKAPPGENDGFDVAPSVSEWLDVPGRSAMQTFLDYIDREDRYCESDITHQLALWRITDNSDIGESYVEDPLAAAGLNLGDAVLQIPHMTNLASQNPETSLFTPPELFVTRIETAGNRILELEEMAILTASIDGPESESLTPTFSWMIRPPSGSFASLTNADGEQTTFVPDVYGSYEIRLTTQIEDPVVGSFGILKTTGFTVPNASTETFEDGILGSSEPYFWEPLAPNPWIVTSDSPYSGLYSAASGDIDHGQESKLRIRFNQTAQERISFVYRVSSEFFADVFRINVDGEQRLEWSGDFGDWLPFSELLSVGDHEIVWSYSKDESESEGADRAWIDDVFLPESAVFTAIESPIDGALPGELELLQNYPNPFTSGTTIEYQLPQADVIQLTVYDAAGREIAVIAEGHREAGRYAVRLNPAGWVSGLYFYELRTPNGVVRDVMTLIE